MSTPNPTLETHPVVVVGAGPTGATVAILLAQAGIPVLVLDRWSGVYPQPRAVHLDDEVYAILERIGLADEFAAISRPSLGLRLMDRQHRVLAEFARSGDAPSSGYPRANMFDQPELEGLLRARMGQLPLITFRGESVVDSVSAGPGAHVVTYTDKRTGRAHQVSSRFVLGCDGANSTVRAAMGSSLRDLRFEQRWLVIDIRTDCDLRQWEGVHQICDSRRAATYMRIGDDRHRWEFQLLDDEKASSFSSITDLRPLLSPWLQDIAADDLEVVRVAEYTFRAMIADTWRQQGLFLLGDAAHLTPPFIGQGMGAGIRDAMNLAWKLAGVLDGRYPASILDTYEHERKPHVRGVIRLAKTIGLMMTAGGRAGDLARRIVAPLLVATPGIKARVTDSETARLRDSSWVARSRRDRLAGRLMPAAHRGHDGGAAAFVLTTLDALPRPQAQALAALGCRIQEVGPSSPLDGQLRTAGARAALVRPDGTVFRSGADATSVADTALSRLAPPATRRRP